MQSVSIADLLAGTISTNKFLITSDDGGIRIQGATQQWSDTDGTVRMQAGRDANGDFTFSLFDKTGKGILIDATGVKPDAIADGLIVNKMIADNAGIAGSKLDIPSVISAINDSSQSIKSSRIWFDEEKQTLNQLYAQINQNITTIQLAAESASNTANTARDAIVTTNQKVSNIETGVEGLRTELSETTTDLHGLTDGTLLYNCYYHDNGDGTTTVTAVVYRAGQDVTAEFPEKSFSWIRKTEAGEQDLGYGYSITVKNSDYMFGGVVVGQFTTDVDENQRKALLSVQEGVVEIDGKPVSLSAEQKDYVDANTLSEVVTIPTGKKFIFTDAATNQGGTVALENLARQILLNLTTQTFELDQGTKTLPDALNELNRDLQYIPIEILAFSNNIGVAEKGSTLNELTLKWQLNKEPETILIISVSIHNFDFSITLCDQNTFLVFFTIFSQNIVFYFRNGFCCLYQFMIILCNFKCKPKIIHLFVSGSSKRTLDIFNCFVCKFHYVLPPYTYFGLYFIVTVHLSLEQLTIFLPGFRTGNSHISVSANLFTP